jgi:hypothetical protein
VIKRNSNQDENFSQHINPIPFRVGMENVERKQMLPNPANMFVPPSALDLSRDLLNGILKPPKNQNLKIKYKIVFIQTLRNISLIYFSP